MDSIKGFAFPFKIGPTGGVVLCSGPDKLKQNLIHLLLTRIGERVMLREYGGGIQELVHDPNDDALRGIVQHQITKAIEEWELRLQVEQLLITQEAGTLYIEIDYTERQNQQPQSLVIPMRLGGY